MADQAVNMDSVAVAEPAGTGNNGSESVAIKPENQDYMVYLQLNDDGTFKAKSLVSGDFAKWEEAHKEDKPVWQRGFELPVTVRGYTVSSFEGLLQLIGGDAEEAVNIVNRGLKQKYSQKINATLLEVDEANKQLIYEPTGEVYDSRALLSEPTRRRNLSVEERFTRAVKDLPGIPADIDADLIKKLLAQLQQANQ